MKDGGNTSQIGKEIIEFDRKGKQPESLTEERKYDHNYPAPLAAYGDVVRDPKLFMDTLGKMHAALGTKFMIPIIGGKELDLHKLFVEVTSRGGIEKVIADRRWREVTGAFSFPSTATNASFVVRKYYMSLLSHYEHIYFFRSQGWNSPPTASLNPPSAMSVTSEKSVEPTSQQPSNIPGVQKRKVNGEHTPSGYSEPPKKMVSGVIDGKVQDGYTVTVRMGDKMYRGILYNPVINTVAQPVQIASTADNSDVRAARRRRRRKKLSERDPTHPKANRSGYNFFFTEQHARLKSLHPGKDREISKMIGDLWNKLPETEKAVYQERGMKDKERYMSEMAVYNEKVKTEMVHGYEVPTQQRRAEPLRITEDMDSKMEIDEGNLPEYIEGGSSTDDSSDTEGKMSDDDSDLEMFTETKAADTESIDIVADPSTEGDGFELRARDDMQMKTDNPSSSEDVESNKLIEPAVTDKHQQ